MNVAARLSAVARQMPTAVAVAEPARNERGASVDRTISFATLDADSTAIAAGLQSIGVQPGMRLALLVRPGIDFVTLVFALLKAGAVQVLIDPGMGRKNLVGCLTEAKVAGFVAVPAAQAVRCVLRKKFSDAKLNVTVGKRWGWGGHTLEKVRRLGEINIANFSPPAISAETPAAIIFTSGSTGPPKGVLYRQGNFDRQVTEIRDFYGIQPGEIDMPCFPLFGLFNAAMGVTSVFPRMDFSRPATIDPREFLAAATAWQATQSFASPAVWNRVGLYCELHEIEIPSLRRVLSAGAPVPAHVLARMVNCIASDGQVHTPYGATEALPVASTTAAERLDETQARTDDGAGVCVGQRFPGIEWRVIAINDSPLPTIQGVRELSRGEIGELIVRGPVATTEYVTRTDANAISKIQDATGFWHRMGDVGYLDEQDRFWFCGRLSQRVLTSAGPMFTIPSEAIFNRHAMVERCALVGVGPRGQQRPVIVAEPVRGQFPKRAAQRQKLVKELIELAQSSSITAAIRDFLFYESLPVDTRHNAKINRELLAKWAAKRLG